MATSLSDGRLWIQTSFTQFKNWPCIASCPWKRGLVNTHFLRSPKIHHLFYRQKKMLSYIKMEVFKLVWVLDIINMINLLWKWPFNMIIIIIWFWCDYYLICLQLNMMYELILAQKKAKEAALISEALGIKPKFDYDSDEDTEGGTWEHKKRMMEMNATRGQSI